MGRGGGLNYASSGSSHETILVHVIVTVILLSGRKQFLRFSTGSSVVPPLGLSSIKISITEESSAIYSSTCINAIKLPVFDYVPFETFKAAMDGAIELDSFTSM